MHWYMYDYCILYKHYTPFCYGLVSIWDYCKLGKKNI